MGPRSPQHHCSSESSSPRAAYVHVPFCQHRCGYCNFALIAGRDDLIESYLQATRLEIQALRHPHHVDTLFIGGGTPTHLPPKDLRQLLGIVSEWFLLAAGGEFSIEANPSDITEETAEILACAGVTRISLGAQSFALDKLRILERSHSANDIDRAVTILKQYDSVISLDLIFGAPQETLSIWKNDLKMALDLKPDHLSTYGLTFEKGSMFYGRLLRGDLNRIDETTDLQMYEFAIECLIGSGFEHYEVSNFSRPGYRCRHNEGYWTQKPYFAIGPGASRFINGIRETNHRSTSTYIKRLLAGSSPVAFRETLSAEALAREALVFGLRRLEGVSKNDFMSNTGFDIFHLLGEPLERFIDERLLVIEDGNLKLTHKGLLISDAIWPDFLTE